MNRNKSNEEYQQTIRKEADEHNDLEHKKLIIFLSGRLSELLSEIKDKGFIKDDRIKEYNKEYLDTLKNLSDDVFK